MKSYTHFTTEERESLYLLLKLGKRPAEIARELGRNRSSVGREINRNKNQNGEYNPVGATKKYRQRRKNCKRKYRIQKGTKLYEYILERLLKNQPPEVIAASWNREHPKERISFSTIYDAINRNVFENVTAKSHLRRRGKKKKSNRSKYNSIHPEHTIHERPEEADNRSRCGDWEGDTVRSSPGKGCIVTFVDRKSRKLISAKSDDMSSKSVLKATLKAFEGITPVRTITLDNGSEFALFKEIEKKLGATVYFADPHSPWQRGTNENTNGLLRFYFPKGFDFTTISDEQLQAVVSLINSRPRLCLDLATPDDVFCCT